MDADLELDALTEPRGDAVALLRRVADDLAAAPPRQAAEALLRLGSALADLERVARRFLRSCSAAG